MTDVQAGRPDGAAPPAPAPGSTSTLPRSLYAVSVVGLVSSTGVGIVAPALPALGERYGVGIAAMSLAVSGLAVGRLLTNLLLGRFQLRRSIADLVAVGLVVQGLTTTIAALSPSYGPFIVFRSLAGVGSAVFTTASTALVVALAPPERRGAASSTYAGAVALGTVAGPALGAVLTVQDARLPLAFYALASFTGAVICRLALRNDRHHRFATTSPSTPRRRFAEVLRQRARVPRPSVRSVDQVFLAALCCQFVFGWIHYGMRASYLPSYLEGNGHTVAFVGLALAVAAGTQVGATALIGHQSDRHGRGVPVVVALVVTAAATVALSVHPTATVVLTSMALAGIGAGALLPLAAALLADSPVGRRGSATSSFWVAFDLAAVTGSLSSGVLGQNVGARSPLFVGTAVALLVLPVALAVTRRERRGADPV